MALYGQTYSPAQVYRGAMQDWAKMAYQPGMQMLGEVAPRLGQMMDYYQPGGGYGLGRRTEAREAVEGGVARDLGSMVASGMSSQFGARGTQMRAGSELSKLYKNIEDTRSQLWQQSTVPYAQMMGQISNLARSRPTYRGTTGRGAQATRPPFNMSMGEWQQRLKNIPQYYGASSF